MLTSHTFEKSRRDRRSASEVIFFRKCVDVAQNRRTSPQPVSLGDVNILFSGDPTGRNFSGSARAQYSSVSGGGCGAASSCGVCGLLLRASTLTGPRFTFCPYPFKSAFGKMVSGASLGPVLCSISSDYELLTYSHALFHSVVRSRPFLY